jgi:myo-inositol 2-dehydrogenase/D-chiro-inositol 1-dehydrogenase
MTPMRLRLGLAGLGIHGIRYAQHLLRGDVPRAVLTAVSRQNASAGRAFAADSGLIFAEDPLDLATHPEVDAVLAVLPPDLHPALARECLARGRPLLVEKPLAADAASAAEVADLAARTGVPLMVSHTLRFDPLVVQLRERAAELGPLRVVALNQRFEPTARTWIDRPGPGGALLNTAVHGFDLMRFLTGAEAVSLDAQTEAAVTRHTEDEAVALVRLAPGPILATLDNARTTAGRSGRIELVGERGQLWGDHVHRGLFRVHGREQEDLGPVPAVPTVALALAAFVDAVLDGTPMPCTAEDGLQAVRMVEAARLSAQSGRRILLSEVRDGERRSGATR